MNSYFVGIDVGSSSVKTAIFDASSGKSIGRAAFPEIEQAIDSPQPGWAEQDPDLWWSHFLAGYRAIVDQHKIDTRRIQAIGISYQMHGLVIVDENGTSLRKSIIWCDSRAVETGKIAFDSIGHDRALATLLNSPGNFTAAKLGWVKEHEPELFGRVAKFMLPGDYIALKLTGRTTTTAGGLSEGVLLNFQTRSVSDDVMRHFGFEQSLLPEIVPAIGDQGTITRHVADLLGLREDVRITYRAGDQPNNAMALNVREPGDVAATGGTSGVIYAVTDKDAYDPKSRINTFLHATDSPGAKRNGILICVNGSGILYSWLRRLFSTASSALSYKSLNEMIATIPAGADGIHFYPFGNGAERILQNRRLNASVKGLDFNRHDAASLARAGVEGIVYALNIGFEILKSLNIQCNSIRAGNANLFLSPTFQHIFANVTDAPLQIYDTDGADGAARVAAIGSGFYSSAAEAYESLQVIRTIEPDQQAVQQYADLFADWRSELPD